METNKLASRLPIFPLFIATSLIVGWFIPDFYVWTESDQSRPSPLLWHVPLWFAIGCFAFCVALPWVPILDRSPQDVERPGTRFSLRLLLMLTAGVAVAIALLCKFPAVTSGFLSAATFAYFIAFWWRSPQHRMAASTLVACMILPYVWLIGYKELSRLLPNLAVMLVGMPAFVPSALISQVFGQRIHDAQWLPFLLTALELALGIWVIHLGPKRTIVYLVLVMQMSVLGSLFFHMLVLA